MLAKWVFAAAVAARMVSVDEQLALAQPPELAREMEADLRAAQEKMHAVVQDPALFAQLLRSAPLQKLAQESPELAAFMEDPERARAALAEVAARVDEVFADREQLRAAEEIAVSQLAEAAELESGAVQGESEDERGVSFAETAVELNPKNILKGLTDPIVPTAVRAGMMSFLAAAEGREVTNEEFFQNALSLYLFQAAVGVLQAVHGKASLLHDVVVGGGIGATRVQRGEAGVPFPKHAWNAAEYVRSGIWKAGWKVHPFPREAVAFVMYGAIAGAQAAISGKPI